MTSSTPRVSLLAFPRFVVGESGPELDILTRGGYGRADRKLGTWSTAFLIINRVVGAGIYSTPSSIISSIHSVGVTLLFWVLGGIMTFW